MLHDGITGSQFVIIDGANHAPIWARPDKLVRVINELLESRSDRAAACSYTEQSTCASANQFFFKQPAPITELGRFSSLFMLRCET
jgi:hypothetical protein